MTIKLKFRECRDCKWARKAMCVRCGAGEFFEDRTGDEPTPEELDGFDQFPSKMDGDDE